MLNSLGFGGAERQAIVLARGLVRRGHTVRIVSFYSQSALACDLVGSAVELVPLGKCGRWDLLHFLPKLATEIRSYDPDVIWPYLTTPNVLAILQKRWIGQPPVIWGVRASNLPLEHYGWVSRLAARLEQGLSGHADRIIVNSSAGLEYAQPRGFPIHRMQVVHNGIDTQRFRPAPESRTCLRFALDIAC